MDVLMSLHKKWSDMILSGTKPFEFRTKLPKNIQDEDTIYIYETSKNKGSKMVVGEFQIGGVLNLLRNDGKWPCYGAYNFIDYYFENIKHDHETAEKFRSAKEEFKKRFENYKYGFIINYALTPEELDCIRKTGHPIDTFRLIENYNTNDYLKRILDCNNKANKAITECDNWLSKMGFYDDCDESYWKYAIVIKNPVRYPVAKEITSFKDKNGNPITKAPQSWMYCKME